MKWSYLPLPHCDWDKNSIRYHQYPKNLVDLRVCYSRGSRGQVEKFYQRELLSLRISCLSFRLRWGGVDRIWRHGSICNPALDRIDKGSRSIDRRSKQSLSLSKGWKDPRFLILSQTLSFLGSMSCREEHLIGTKRDIGDYKKRRLVSRVLLPHWILSSGIGRSDGDSVNRIPVAKGKHFQG